MGPREEGTDRWGSDYKSFAVQTGHTETCEEACKGDTQCLAWTYVKPAVQGPQAICYLKNNAPVTRRADCCVSGVKITVVPRRLTAPPLIRSSPPRHPSRGHRPPV